MTNEIAQTILEKIDPRGVAVVCEGTHLCMSMRGVEKQNSYAVTSAMLGIFRDNARTRMEFLELIRQPGRRPYRRCPPMCRWPASMSEPARAGGDLSGRLGGHLRAGLVAGWSTGRHGEATPAKPARSRRRPAAPRHDRAGHGELPAVLGTGTLTQRTYCDVPDWQRRRGRHHRDVSCPRRPRAPDVRPAQPAHLFRRAGQGQEGLQPLHRDELAS